MEENKVVEMGVEALGKVDGNLKVVIGTAIGTLALTAGIYFGVKKGKEAIRAHKVKKSKVTEEAPEKDTNKK